MYPLNPVRTDRTCIITQGHHDCNDKCCFLTSVVATSKIKADVTESDATTHPGAITPQEEQGDGLAVDDTAHAQ